ncbi:MAG: hypothetical protein M3Q23_02075 [Actinomycetota bacterium]|nr:hypothetical protein [Actinomycetota bacterium]
MEQRENPPVPVPLRLISAAQTAILAATGATMFFDTGFAQSIWPWTLTPFNARFIGGFYLGAAVGAAVTTVVGRWALWRVIHGMSVVFTAMVLVVSLFHLDRFSFDRWGAWAWFALYGLLPLSTAVAWYRCGGLPTGGRPLRRGVQRVLVAQALVLGAYGVALVIAPVALAKFWPWPVDRLHGQLYAAVFVTAAVGPLMMARRAHRQELLGAGITWIAAGGLIILSVVVTDAGTHTVDYGSVGTWVWFAGFAFLAAMGILMMGAARGAVVTVPRETAAAP